MNQQDIEQVVKAVLLKMKDSSQPAGTVHDMGVFASLDDAVAAATVAQQGLKRVAMRQQVIQAIREAGEKYARELAELAVTETGMGRVEDKFAKNVAQARGTPGVECLTPQVLTGDNGLTLIENAPWGVVASVTPSTNPAATVIKFLLGWELIPGLDPIFMAPGDQPGEVMRAIEVIGSISCVLLGAYPMVLLLTRWFEKPLMRVGNLLKINNMAAGGMVATLANNIPMFGMMKQMDTRGKVINCAFSVSAAFALGDHLGFAAANMNAMIFPMIVGKLVGGVTAIGVAMLLVPKDENVPAPANNEAEAHS